MFSSKNEEERDKIFKKIRELENGVPLYLAKTRSFLGLQKSFLQDLGEQKETKILCHFYSVKLVQLTSNYSRHDINAS